MGESFLNIIYKNLKNSIMCLILTVVMSHSFTQLNMRPPDQPPTPTPTPSSTANNQTNSTSNSNLKATPSVSLLGDEWLQKRAHRTNELRSHLEQAELKTHTFTPTISKFDRSDRPKSVLESMAQKEKQAEGRLKLSKKRVEDQFLECEDLTFSPKLNKNSSSLLQSSSYKDEPLTTRMSKKQVSERAKYC